MYRGFASVLVSSICAAFVPALIPSGASAARAPVEYRYPETRERVALVDDAAKLVQSRGEAAFEEFRVAGSRWRRGESYVFVLDPGGDMLVHPDPAMEGKNEMALKDVNGKPIIRGLIDAATTIPGKPEGWYHYEWPVPGEILPRWKSSYVRLVTAPSGKRYVVGSGVYDNRMEKPFVVDIVEQAASRIEKKGQGAYAALRDPQGPFIVKDAYVFVLDDKGVLLVNPAFPNLEGRSLIDQKDTQGKPFVRELLDVARTRGNGWVDYMWPKPGESVSTQKSTYVMRTKLGGNWVVVACGVYLADAPTARPVTTVMSAPQLMALVRDAAAEFEKRGDQAYPAFRQRGSKWFRDDTYFFVWTMDGVRAFHAADPTNVGKNESAMTDIHGRPIGRMILAVAHSPSGEGWIHYMYPEPGSLFPVWKSTFLKRVKFPDGKQYVIGCGVYNMKMDRAFIEDVVNRAAALVEKEGARSFDTLRDKRGPFVFMDTYVFVDAPDGTELVNGGQPSLEGRNLMGLKDVKGKAIARDYIDAAMKNGSGWVGYEWYKPGSNVPAHKQTYVRKVQSGKDTFIVGSGFYVEPEAVGRRPLPRR